MGGSRRSVGSGRAALNWVTAVYKLVGQVLVPRVLDTRVRRPAKDRRTRVKVIEAGNGSAEVEAVELIGNRILNHSFHHQRLHLLSIISLVPEYSSTGHTVSGRIACEKKCHVRLNGPRAGRTS